MRLMFHPIAFLLRSLPDGGKLGGQLLDFFSLALYLGGQFLNRVA
jgi:hypothetical protein